MSDDEVKAMQVALVTILARNWDVLDWYIKVMFHHMPPAIATIMFKLFGMIDKNSTLTPDTMWRLIPAFISSLTTDQFRTFITHMGGIAKAMQNEYTEYLPTKVSESKSIPISGPSHDNHRTDREWKDNASQHDINSSNEQTVSNTNT